MFNLNSTMTKNKYAGKCIYITGHVRIDGKRIKFSNGEKIMSKEDLLKYSGKYGISQLKKPSWRKINLIIKGEGEGNRNNLRRATEKDIDIIKLKDFIDEFKLDYELVD